MSLAEETEPAPENLLKKKSESVTRDRTTKEESGEDNDAMSFMSSIYQDDDEGAEMSKIGGEEKSGSLFQQDNLADFSPSRFMHVRPNFTSVASEPVDRIYLEKVTGFSSTSQRKINAIGKFAGSQNQVDPAMVRATMTPLDLGLECQNLFMPSVCFAMAFSRDWLFGIS